ncbi:MAG: outer membrane lipoprotein-sorting protein [Deltaproteobacteria bacterium]|nr:outer membrane lipoprotein-sorting protein [Deltaproteobacteria bacterium]
MRSIKLFVALCAAAAVLASAFYAHAEDDAKAREIMQKVQDRYDGDTSVADQEMILKDKRGRKRVRKIKTYEKDFGEDTYSIMFFVEPADVKDTSFLTYDYDAESKDDDQWLYLPALKKVKRIASSDKDDPFMGSDFNYGDMTKRELSKFTFKLLGEKDVRGQKCWLIEATPISQDVVEEYGYDKYAVFVRQDNYVVVRGVFWVENSDKIKYLDVPDLKQIEGIWTPVEMHMKTQQGERVLHSTIFKTLAVDYNVDLPDSMFTTRRMEKGL